MIPEKVLSYFKGKSVLVTGGTGLIGRQVVDILTEIDAHVNVVSLDQYQVNKKAKYTIADLSDFSVCKELTANVDLVFHIAGIKGSVKVTRSKPASFFVPLLMMNTNLLEACRINKVHKTVYTSSVGAYASAEIFREDKNIGGPPMDMFPGMAKRMAEQQITAYKIQYGLRNFSIVRPSNVYGPGDNFDPNNAMVIPSLIYRIFKGEDPVIIWGNGSAIRDFAYSKDIAEGIILALYYGTNSSFINLGSGIGYSIKQLVETLHSFVDFNYEFDDTESSGFSKRVMDISLAQELIGYKPKTSLKNGLINTWEWFLKNPTDYLSRQNYFTGEIKNDCT